ncbi:MAG: slr1659 superfamily regulator [Prochlorotrichaceae cyanobacterium]|jgi:hypothetical protein
MLMTEITGDKYVVKCDDGTATVTFQGSLRLGGPSEYKPIADLLSSVADQEPETITLDLTQLEFLNSSGISTLSKFVIGLRKKRSIQAVIIGSSQIPWQGKSLKNLQKLMPGLKLELV